MEKTMKLFEQLKKDYNGEKEHPEKFMVSAMLAYPENKDFLDKPEFNIKLKPAQWAVLTIEPEILQKTLLRAKDLGFLEAYQQNPAFLKSDVDKIVKRISECEANGISYKNEKGKYHSWLFSDRGYNYMFKQTVGAPTKEENSSEINPEIDALELKEYADRVMEAFALTDKKEEVYEHLKELTKSNLGVKEILIELFKKYTINLEYLNSSIDEILAYETKEKLGRVA